MNNYNENPFYLKEMYEDSYFPDMCVDKVSEQLNVLERGITEGKKGVDEIQNLCDQIIENINELQELFEEHDSEIESVAAESIGNTIRYILDKFEISLDVEDAMRMREW